MHTIPFPIVGGFILLGYFVPSVLAFIRGHRYLRWICLMNALMGWTIVGWVIAFIWAASSPHRPHRWARWRHSAKRASARRHQALHGRRSRGHTHAARRRTSTLIGPAMLIN